MLRLAINGFGRIGKLAFQIAREKPGVEVVAINNLSPLEMSAYLLKHDTVYGHYPHEVKTLAQENCLVVDGQKYPIFQEKDPANLPWGKLGVDVVLECTGAFTSLEGASKHLVAGAKEVVISALGKDESIETFVIGVNDDKLAQKKGHIIANASCTTNCASPLVKVLNDKFKIEKAQLLTVHAMTNSQNLVDGTSKDLRACRAAVASIIPETTGAAKGVLKVIPELEGRLYASAFRVPVLCGSVLEVVAQVKKETNAEEVNATLKEASLNQLKGVLEYSTEALVSNDIIGNTHSAIVDSLLTEVINLPGQDENLIKIVAWYDNEWGYTNRLVEMAVRVGKLVK
ncbi:MAG: type I glyceraldehyde-3-phosphate dehydrogenase [Candidatus Omnitrophica bacterium CG1_02_46_14]|nr:MAG: type I glyceraldehyde-3-phosphate dehydrogenase [Candidatus Omnitrophica bacterium CG1_02_46_14]